MTRMLSRSLLAELPWDQLSNQLSPSAVLIDGSAEKYIDECATLFFMAEMDENFTVSQWDLNAAPSGLCMNFLVNAYEECIPYDSVSYADGAITGFELFSDAQALSELFLNDPTNPRYDLPYKVLQPTAASDVVAAVSFANENNVEISVKNSGHHYAGASTKKDTILVYTPTLPKYSDTSLMDCAAGGDDEEEIDLMDLSNQPCKLAVARNAAAALRVGGGENWNDVYSNVRAYNEAEDEFKYHPVGGAAATVTPMGWTWQGGLAGTQMGRTVGFGADQVLQLEMVLPNGQHVKFGPTEWEDASDDGYIYPKTTKVSGACNQNPTATDEADYVWEPCGEEEGINFDDLWFAVRGGGGGTWGVVISTYLQLHPYPGTLNSVVFDYAFYWALSTCNKTSEECEENSNTLAGIIETGVPFPDGVSYEHDPSATCERTAEECEGYKQELTTLLAEFYLDFYLDQENGKCGSPAGANGNNFCFGDSGDDMIAAWQSRVEEERTTLMETKGLPKEIVDGASVSLGVEEKPDYFADVAGAFPEGHRHHGKGGDSPDPAIFNYMLGGLNTIIPKTVVQNNKDYWISWMQNKLSLGPFADNPYLAHAEKTDDQASSLSQAHREAAFMVFPMDGEEVETVLQMLFGDMDYNGDFPGFLGSNHFGPFHMGPLKTDWTKQCPPDLTWEERAEECISLQEAIWGTKRLQRLEQIKADVDPKNLFNCYLCIKPPATTSDPDETVEGSGDGPMPPEDSEDVYFDGESFPKESSADGDF